MTMQNATTPPVSFTRGEILQAAPPPASLVGPIGWVRANLFSSPLQALLTLVGAYIAYKLVWTFVDFTIIRAVWTGADRDACLDEKVGRSVGACWPFVWAKFGQFMYGFYPLDSRWRVDLTGIIALILLIPLLIPSVPYKALNAVLFFGAFPILAFNLLYGGSLINPWLVVLGWLLAIVGIGLLVAYLMSRAEGGANDRFLKIGAGALAFGVVALLIVRSNIFAVPALPVVETRNGAASW